MRNGIPRWTHRKTANSRAVSSFLIPSLILSPAFPLPFILCLDICLLSCWTDKNRNDSIRKTEHVRTRHTKSGPCCHLASPFTRSNLDRLPQSGTWGLCAAKDSDYHHGSVVVLSGFWLAGWQDPAAPGVQSAGAGAALWHGRQDSWTVTARARLGDTGWGTLALGHWFGDTGLHGSGHCWPSLGQGLCPRVRSAAADVPAGSAPDSPGLEVLKALVFSASECVMLCWSN